MLVHGSILLLLSLQVSARAPIARTDATTTISGRVVDGAGTPLDLVFVVSHPVLGGTITHAQTDSNGAFSLTVARDGMNLVALETEDMDKDEETAPGAREGERFALIQGGRTDLRFILRDPKLVTFTVVEAATGLPVERFGLGIAWRHNLGTHGITDQQEIAPRPHPRGEAVTHADPARHVVRVQAPGFASLEANVQPEVGSAARQSLRLERGGSLIGRVSSSDRPLARASVAVVRGPIGRVYDGPIGRVKAATSDRYEPDSWFRADYPGDLGEYVGRPRFVESGGDGSFRVDDLSVGTYDVVVGADGLGPKLLKRIHIDAGGTRDLGVLALEAPAVLRGKVVLGPGASLSGLAYTVDGAFRERRPITATDGTFVIEGLGAGVHRLTLGGPPSMLEDDVREVRLKAGEIREVVFDLSGSAPCSIEVRVKRAGKPFGVAGVEAHLMGQASTTEPRIAEHLLNLRPTPAKDGFAGSAPGGQNFYCLLLGDRGQIVGRSSLEKLPSGGRREIEIAIDPGSLEIRFPDSLDVPEHGALDITLKRAAEQARSIRATTQPSASRNDAPAWSGRTFDVGWLEPGKYDVTLRAEDEGTNADDRKEKRPSRILISGFHTTIEVAPGGSATVVVP